MTISAESVVYLRGQFLPASQASLTIYDAGLILAATVTEMTRTFRHRAFRLEDHVDRLFRSAKSACITTPLTRVETLWVSEQLIERNTALIGPEADLSFCQFLTPGEIGVYAGRTGRGGGCGADVLHAHVSAAVCKLATLLLRRSSRGHTLRPPDSSAMLGPQDEMPQPHALVAGG